MICKRCGRSITATEYGYGTAQPGPGCYHAPQTSRSVAGAASGSMSSLDVRTTGAEGNRPQSEAPDASSPVLTSVGSASALPGGATLPAFRVGRVESGRSPAPAPRPTSRAGLSDTAGAR